MEWADGWQYGLVWRTALAGGDPLEFDPLGPPAGGGWELNVDCGDKGRDYSTPRWSDGRIVIQRTHWRRPQEGIQPWQHGARVQERVRYDGDPSPA